MHLYPPHLDLHYLAKQTDTELHLFTQMLYHGLRGSASPVLTATGFVNGRWQFSTPHRIHTI